MDRAQVFERVTKVLTVLLLSKDTKKKTDVASIEWDTDLYDDLGLDSLELLDLLTALEEEFKINPDQYDAATKRTISQIVDYTIQLLKEKTDGIKK